MAKRKYYSVRTNKNSNPAQINLATLNQLFQVLYKFLLEQGYFEEAFGDRGKLGTDIEAQMFRKLRKANLYPIENKCIDYSEDDLFDVIEFLYDWVSKPINGYYDIYDGYEHPDTFDKEKGQQEFSAEINELLFDYKNGFELSKQGEILELAEPGLDGLFEASFTYCDSDNVEMKVRRAILKFQRYRSSIDERHDAVRELVDVLEFLRPKLKNVLTTKDESDLFNIANNFGIRHHNENQKTEYDKEIWYSWMFYYYLTTIYASLKLINKEEQSRS